MLIAPPAHIHALHVHYVHHQHTHRPVHDYGVYDGVEPLHEQGRLGGHPWTCAQTIGLGLGSPCSWGELSFDWNKVEKMTIDFTNNIIMIANSM